MPHLIADQTDLTDFVLRVYRACQNPAVLEAGEDAIRAVGNGTKSVGKLVKVFRSAWHD